MIKNILVEKSNKIQRQIDINFEKYPHLLICGPTGSGKTYFAKLLLGKIAKYEHTSKIIVCDFKGDDDFSNIVGSFRYKEAKVGLNNFFAIFEARQSGQSLDRSPIFLYFDELGAFLTILSKKESDIIKNRIATILMLGRSFNVHLIVALQRADAAYFTVGARDNFSARIGLGRLSVESRHMLFPDYDKSFFEMVDTGQGYLLLDGSAIKKILVPHYSNFDLLENTINNSIL